VRGGQRSAFGAEVDGERQSRVGERSVAAVGRGENKLLLRTDSERRRCMGRRLHALRVEAGRQVVRVGAAAGAVGASAVGMMHRHARARPVTGRRFKRRLRLTSGPQHFFIQ
jgi:hypothetical protein